MDGQTASPTAFDPSGGQTGYEGWTPEQIQQYYAQYGYDYYAQYQQQAAQSSMMGYSNYQSETFNPYAANGVAALPPRPPGGQEPTRTIWIGNVNPETTESELHGAFARFGLVESVKVLPAKSCAFVRFGEIEAAIQAHAVMHGAVVRGQQIRVGWGKPEPSGADAGPPPCRNLWIGNVGPEISEEVLRNHFGQFGVIDRVRLMPQKNCAFINFVSLEAATKSKQHMNGAMIGGRSIKINYGRDTGFGFAPPSPTDPYKNIEAPPAEAGPPEDLAERNIIEKLCEYVKRNGAAFEVLTRDRQRDSPKFQFLNSEHPSNAYYKWKLWRTKYPEVDDQTIQQIRMSKGNTYGAVPPPKDEPSIMSLLRPRNNAQQDVPPESSQYSIPPPLYGGPDAIIPPPVQMDDKGQLVVTTHEAPASPIKITETIKQLAQMLEALTPTKDSIKVTKNWIMEQPVRLARDMASFIRARSEKLQDFEQKLNVVYLIHDVLYHTFRNRQNPLELDDYATAFEPHLGFILKAAFEAQPPENQEKVIKVLKLWEEKQIFDTKIIKRMDDEMRGRYDRERRERERERDRERERRSRGDDYYGDRDRGRERSDRRKRSRSRSRDRDKKRH